MRADKSSQLNPGILRHQISWERKTVTGRDAIGQDTYEWTRIVIVKAQVKSLIGQELQIADQRSAEARYQILQHYVPGLQRADRGSWFVDGVTRYLDIVDVQDHAGTGRAQVIIAKEWTA